MMNLRPMTKRLIAYSIPVLILGGMTVSPLMTTLAGEEIQLKTTPVDPRDLFRGDHVLLSLEVEEISAKRLSQAVAERIATDDSYELFDVFVKLHKKGDAYEVKQVVSEKPTSGIYLKGQLDPWISDADNTVMVSYNLDRYFVPENTGMELEEGAREGNALVTLKVRNGHAIIQKVELDESS